MYTFREIVKYKSDFLGVLSLGSAFPTTTEGRGRSVIN